MRRRREAGIWQSGIPSRRGRAGCDGLPNIELGPMTFPNERVLDKVAVSPVNSRSKRDAPSIRGPGESSCLYPAAELTGPGVTKEGLGRKWHPGGVDGRDQWSLCGGGGASADDGVHEWLSSEKDPEADLSARIRAICCSEYSMVYSCRYDNPPFYPGVQTRLQRAASFSANPTNVSQSFANLPTCKTWIRKSEVDTKSGLSRWGAVRDVISSPRDPAIRLHRKSDWLLSKSLLCSMQKVVCFL
jgi:hypothetical protein